METKWKPNGTSVRRKNSEENGEEIMWPLGRSAHVASAMRDRSAESLLDFSAKIVRRS